MSRQEGDGSDEPVAAIGWFTRFLQEDISALTPDELIDWADWSADPLNLEEFRRVKRMWRTLGPALARASRPSEAAIAADEYDESQPIAAWLANRNAAATTSGAREEHPAPVRWWALATSLAIGLAAIYGYHYLMEHSGDLTRSYVTGTSERRWISLPDASTIVMGPRTKISTHYTVTNRVVLLDRGEAWFSATGNPKRPFTVIAGSAAITAIGTQFDVQREPSDGDRVTVSVNNGTVEVGLPKDAAMAKSTPHAAPASQRVPSRLKQGEKVSYDRSGHLGEVENVDPAFIADWKQGRLVYLHTPLREAVPRVSRYSDKPVTLDENDAEVGELRFSGIILEGQVEEWLRALEESYPVDVTHEPDRIVIRMRHDEASP